MESELYSLISQFTFLKNGAEREINIFSDYSLMKKCVEQKNASIGSDYIEITNHTEPKKYSNSQTMDALLRLTETQIVQAVFVKVPRDGAVRQIGIYSLNNDMRKVLAECLKIKYNVE